MFRKSVAPSSLPTFLLPCPLCGHRMAVTQVARLSGGKESRTSRTLRIVVSNAALRSLARCGPLYDPWAGSLDNWRPDPDGPIREPDRQTGAICGKRG